jgi:phosphomevalonate kinase
MMLVTSAPGKLMLAGEYAVIDGGPALMMAVSRRVIAYTNESRRPASEFLTAVCDYFADPTNPDANPQRHLEAQRTLVDSSQLYLGTQKLGLGSSAAVTVAAVAHVLATTSDQPPAPAQVLRIASSIHAAVQQRHGASGSGADLAAITHGGLLRFVRQPDVYPIHYPTLPTGLHLHACFVGSSASTTSLVGAVHQARDNKLRLGPVNQALQEIRLAADRACDAVAADNASAFLDALASNAHGVAALGQAAGIDIETPAVRKLRTLLPTAGCVVKTTGAGGGDIAIVVADEHLDETIVTAAIIQAGCSPVPLALDPQGVDFTAAKR